MNNNFSVLINSLHFDGDIGELENVSYLVIIYDFIICFSCVISRFLPFRLFKSVSCACQLNILTQTLTNYL